MYLPRRGPHPHHRVPLARAGASSLSLSSSFADSAVADIHTHTRPQDYEVRRSLILKTDHLLSLFESPRQVIAKRNDKMLDHSRYLAKKLPVDRRGSEEFLLLSSQLLEELPRFLGSVSRYFNIIVGHFAGAQAAYHEAVQERWNAFAEQWVVQVGGDSYEDIEASFAEQHEPLDQMMETLAAGLGLAIARASPGSRPVASRHDPLPADSPRLRVHRLELELASDPPARLAALAQVVNVEPSVVGLQLVAPRHA